MPSLLKPLAKDKNKTHLLHAILFPKSNFSISDAINWLNQNNLKFVHNRDTTNFHRFRIRETIYGWLFYTKTLNDGVEMIYMYKPLYYPIISDKPNKKFFIITPEGEKKLFW